MRRKRGAKKGNQNVRKHGFYASVLSPAEICEFWNTVNLEGIDPEIAVFRIRLRSLLQCNPGNHRALAEASRSLSRWFCMKYELEPESFRLLKAAIVRVLENYSELLIPQSGKPVEKDMQFLQKE